MRLHDLPRIPLGAWPTPLELRPGLSDAAGVPVYVKRDDLSGLGVGGNKVRKLEYLLADAQRCGADTVVTAGGRQSNHAALTALAAARVGLDCHLVHYGDPPAGPPEGNGVLMGLAGAHTTFTGDDDRSSVDHHMEQIERRLQDEGRTPYVIPRGGATAVGCAAYVRASLELWTQLADLGVMPSTIVIATGSCGTQAGLHLGAEWLQAPYRVVGVTVSRPRPECLERIQKLATACGELLELHCPGEREIEVRDDYLGPGYGQPSPEAGQAMRLLARTEGLLLDPVFTAKAMVALLDLARTDSGPLVFWHTGGAGAAFAPSKSVL